MFDICREGRKYRHKTKAQLIEELTSLEKRVQELTPCGASKGCRGNGSDIVGRVAAEKRASTAQNQLTEAIEALSEGFVLFDADDRFVACNTEYRKIFAPVSEILIPGLLFEDWVLAYAKTGQDLDTVGSEEEWLEQRMRDHRNPTGPREYRLADGRYIRLLEYKTNSGGTAGLRMDITESKRAEAALKESEENFRNLTEGSIQGICILDSDRRILFVNQAYADIFGYDSPEGILALKTVTVLIAPHDQDRLTGYRLARLCGEPAPTNYECDGVRINGETVHLQVISRRIVWQGRDAVQVTLFDITERQRAEEELKKSEEIFRDFAELGSDWLWEMDENLRYKSLSPNIVLAGIEPAALFGNTMEEALRNGNNLGPLDEELRALRARKPFRVERKSISSPGRWRRVRGKPLFSEEGTFLGYRGVTTDITEQKDAEEQLLRSQRMEAVGQLAGGIAHDFNNLMSVMMGNADLLADRVGGDEKALRRIERIRTAVRRGASLTDRLLAFSRKQTLLPQATNIDGLIGGLDDMLRRTLGETIDLKVVLNSELWPSITDPSQLEHALVNLAVNARDAMPNGGVLTIETDNAVLDESFTDQQEDVTPGDYVKVSIGDNGTGMTPEVREKAFEPFFTTKDVGEGNGLGLSMVYGFAKQSGGYVAIFSEVDEGTTVSIYLPRSEEDAKEDAETEAREIPHGSERILIVEDDESVREIPVSFLRDQGYHVFEAADGKEAITLLQDDGQFDLLFTDVVLPGGMSGVEIALEAQRLHLNIKVLYTTGYAESAVVNNGRLDKGDAVIRKPYELAALGKKVRGVLDNTSE